MSIFKTLTCNIGSYYYFLREIISPSLIRDAKEIPIIINNFNRLTTLRLLTETLTACGYTNIYILDNASTYPPLLEYYKTCPFTVFHLNQNLGFKALWESPLKKRFCNDYYIYTDSDVIPSDYCPKDFIDYFFKELKKKIRKIDGGAYDLSDASREEVLHYAFKISPERTKLWEEIQKKYNK